MMLKNIYKRYVILSDRSRRRLTNIKDYEYSASSLTGTSLHSLPLYRGGTLIVQGDKIVAIEYHPIFSFRAWLKAKNHKVGR